MKTHGETESALISMNKAPGNCEEDHSSKPPMEGRMEERRMRRDRRAKEEVWVKAGIL